MQHAMFTTGRLPSQTRLRFRGRFASEVRLARFTFGVRLTLCTQFRLWTGAVFEFGLGLWAGSAFEFGLGTGCVLADDHCLSRRLVWL